MPNGRPVHQCERGGCERRAHYQVTISEPTTGDVIHAMRFCIVDTALAHHNARQNHLAITLTPLRRAPFLIPIELPAAPPTSLIVAVAQ